MPGPLVFSVHGHPAPQGSKKPVGRGKTRLIEDNPRTKPWREAVALQVRRQLPRAHRPIDGPVLLGARFTMPRTSPKPFPSTKAEGQGDEDKLVRAVCDALTSAGVWADDSRVVRHFAASGWPGTPGFRPAPGCDLLIIPIVGDYLADLHMAWWDDLLEVTVPVQDSFL